MDGAIEPHRFALALVDSTWRLSDGVLRLLRHHTDCGVSETRHERGSTRIEARSGLAGIRPEVREAMEPASDPGLERAANRLGSIDATLRSWIRTSWVESDHGTEIATERWIVIRRNDGALDPVVVVRDDLEIPDWITDRAGSATPPAVVPLLFASGSGAIVAHELAGHPAESGEPASARSIRIVDDPTRSRRLDDTGIPTSLSDLTNGGTVATRRRAGFADVPLRRMTAIRVEAVGDPTPVPPRCIVIDAVADGAWDRVAQIATLRVVRSAFVSGSDRQQLRPFSLTLEKADLERLAPASTKVRPYPGVVCSDEGQRLVVESASVDLLLHRDDGAE